MWPEEHQGVSGIVLYQQHAKFIFISYTDSACAVVITQGDKVDIKKNDTAFIAQIHPGCQKCLNLYINRTKMPLERWINCTFPVAQQSYVDR